MHALHEVTICVGSVTAQVTCRLLNREAHVQSRDTPCRICDKQSGFCAGIFPNTLIFACQLSFYQCIVLCIVLILYTVTAEEYSEITSPGMWPSLVLLTYWDPCPSGMFGKLLGICWSPRSHTKILELSIQVMRLQKKKKQKWVSQLSSHDIWNKRQWTFQYRISAVSAVSQ
jgi:hypothetical protein